MCGVTCPITSAGAMSAYVSPRAAVLRACRTTRMLPVPSAVDLPLGWSRRHQLVRQPVRRWDAGATINGSIARSGCLTAFDDHDVGTHRRGQACHAPPSWSRYRDACRRVLVIVVSPTGVCQPTRAATANRSWRCRIACGAMSSSRRSVVVAFPLVRLVDVAGGDDSGCRRGTDAIPRVDRTVVGGCST
jgi:hypothetical protein